MGCSSDQELSGEAFGDRKPPRTGWTKDGAAQMTVSVVVQTGDFVGEREGRRVGFGVGRVGEREGERVGEKEGWRRVSQIAARERTLAGRRAGGTYL